MRTARFCFVILSASMVGIACGDPEPAFPHDSGVVTPRKDLGFVVSTDTGLPPDHDSGTTANDTGINGGDSGTTTGDSGTMTTGDSGTMTTGDSGTMTTGDSGTVTTGDAGTVTTGDAGTVTTGDSGTVTTGDAGTTNNDGGVMTSDSGTAVGDTGTVGSDATTTTNDAGTTGNDGGASTHDGGTFLDGGVIGNFDPASRARTLAEAQCMNNQRCSPAYFPFNASRTYAECVDIQTAENTILFNAIAAKIVEATVSFDDQVFAGCVSALANNDCDLGLPDGACDYFVGLQTQGSACGLNTECADGLWCSGRAAVGACGTCEPRVANAGDCSVGLCAETSRCVTVQGNPTCVADNLGENASCGTVGTGLCRGQLSCVLNPAGNAASCARRGRTGDMCSGNNQGGLPICNINHSAACVNGTCAAVSFSAVGGSCAAPDQCNNTGVCNTANSQCVSRPTAGMPCANNVCALGAYCDGSFCQDRAAEGVACASSGQCEVGLTCVGMTAGMGVCQQLNTPACTAGTSMDAGVADSGTTVDAGATADAGTAADAGTTADAGTMSDPFDPATVAAAYSAADCASRTRCSPATGMFLNQSEQQCATERSAALTIEYNAIANAIAAGRVTFSQTQLDACIAALGASDCDRGLDLGVCDPFTGQQGNGDACYFAGECADGFFCAIASFGSCGSCQPEAPIGGSCAAAPCVDGARCFNVGGMNTCLDVTLDENASCGTSQTGLCRGRLQCIINAAQTAASCTRPAANGAACATTSQVTPNCNSLAGDICVNGTCQTVSFGGVGGSCNPPSQCDSSGVCNAGNLMCAARPTAGQPCAAGACADDHYCDAQDFCQSNLQQGAACNAGETCGTGLVCIGAPGAQTCEVLAWTQCP